MCNVLHPAGEGAYIWSGERKVKEERKKKEGEWGRGRKM